MIKKATIQLACVLQPWWKHFDEKKCKVEVYI